MGIVWGLHHEVTGGKGRGVPKPKIEPEHGVFYNRKMDRSIANSDPFEGQKMMSNGGRSVDNGPVPGPKTIGKRGENIVLVQERGEPDDIVLEGGKNPFIKHIKRGRKKKSWKDKRTDQWKEGGDRDSVKYMAEDSVSSENLMTPEEFDAMYEADEWEN